MSFTGDIGAYIRGTYLGLNDIFAPSAANGALSDVKMSLTPGIGAEQADKVFSDTRNLAASATENIDLAGALNDVFGAALTFVKVKGILVRAKASNTNNVVIGGAASNAFVGPFGANTHTVSLAPGQVFIITATGLAGWPVVAGTGDLLKVTNGGAGSAVDYDIVLIGTSA